MEGGRGGSLSAAGLVKALCCLTAGSGQHTSEWVCGSWMSLALQQLSLHAWLLPPTQQIWETGCDMSLCGPGSRRLLPPVPFLGDSLPLPAM